MKLREITAYDENLEQITIRTTAIFIPVEFKLPDRVRETMGLLELKTIEGNKVLRFYCPPGPGDSIIWKGHEWKVLCYRHRPTKKGSRDEDKLPNILTMYCGPFSEIGPNET
jgi:hypothetical protein